MKAFLIVVVLALITAGCRTEVRNFETELETTSDTGGVLYGGPSSPFSGVPGGVGIP
jgi:hypothetical protein